MFVFPGSGLQDGILQFADPVESERMIVCPGSLVQDKMLPCADPKHTDKLLVFSPSLVLDSVLHFSNPARGAAQSWDVAVAFGRVLAAQSWEVVVALERVLAARGGMLLLAMELSRPPVDENMEPQADAWLLWEDLLPISRFT
ncbi:hypothetical protein H6P81_017486 [Aristolochia fimbriata]|uniref:Uncharacterized protein n=1 Tax=Aristolochia fimbriata TaxID=158543 RepID=A0AAV7E1C0_ARIFI|nr:hypothetical protein H6P81_017486 [Aristolochia fimbriata]